MVQLINAQLHAIKRMKIGDGREKIYFAPPITITVYNCLCPLTQSTTYISTNINKYMFVPFHVSCHFSQISYLISCVPPNLLFFYIFLPYFILFYFSSSFSLLLSFPASACFSSYSDTLFSPLTCHASFFFLIFHI